MGSCTRCFSHMRSYGMKMGTSRCFESIQRGKLRYPSSARLPMCSYFHSISWQAAINMHLTCTNMHQHAPSSHMSQLPIKLCYVRPIVAFGNLKVGDGSITDWALLYTLSPWAMVEIHVILDPIRVNLHRMFHHAPCLVWSPPSIWKVGQMTPRRSFQRWIDWKHREVPIFIPYKYSLKKF